eukprot:m.257835 g.257835  ORF g.257835 m.257835 type:complete len:174 (-) comp35756_c0_seq1:100-621(-)
MFYTLLLEEEILLAPEHFGPGIKNKIRSRLYSEVEATCSGKYGFIISVISVKDEDIKDGEIIPGKGHVMFPVTYKAIVYRPFKGEIVDAIVKSVTKAGIMAGVGPLTIFVSKHWIPEELEFDGNSIPPCFKSEAETISVEDGIRLQILGIRVDVAEIFATGSLAGDFLGPVTQ